MGGRFAFGFTAPLASFRTASMRWRMRPLTPYASCTTCSYASFPRSARRIRRVRFRACLMCIETALGEVSFARERNTCATRLNR